MKTHCKHGHEFTPENTFVRLRPRPHRVCRTCHRETVRRSTSKRTDYYREKQREWRRMNPGLVAEIQANWRARNVMRIRQHGKAYDQIRKYELCPACSTRKKLRTSIVCKICTDLAAFLTGSREGTRRSEVTNLLPDLQNQQLQRSYKCLRDSKKKLNQLQQQLNQTGKMGSTGALALLRETASALLAEC